MSEKKRGELSAWKFAVSTFLLLGLALVIFVPLSRNMKTVEDASESQKKIEALEKRISEIDVLKGRVDEMNNRSPVPEPKSTPKKKQGD
jgi:hypothetical protein